VSRLYENYTILSKELEDFDTWGSATIPPTVTSKSH
jgi:hypothetical protein